MIDQAYKRAEEIITEHREELERVTQTLLEKETLDAAEFEALLTGAELPAPGDDYASTDHGADLPPAEQHGEGEAVENAETEANKTTEQNGDPAHAGEGEDSRG